MATFLPAASGWVLLIEQTLTDGTRREFTDIEYGSTEQAALGIATRKWTRDPAVTTMKATVIADLTVHQEA